MKKANELFIKQMTRKEFLQFIVLAILGVFGFKNFVTFLMDYQQQGRRGAQPVEAKTTTGFGSSKFGI